MNAWIQIEGCAGTPVPTPGVPVTITLYYIAAAGQVTFPLNVPDKFGNVATLNSNSDLLVYRSGNQLTYVDGYTIDLTGNAVSLAYPAGVGEPIVFDILSSTSAGPPGPPGPPGTGGGTSMVTDVLTIATLNTIPALSHAPDGVVLMLNVNGTSFFAVGPQAAFTFSGSTLTWTSTLFSIPAGAAVIAVYSHA